MLSTSGAFSPMAVAARRQTLKVPTRLISMTLRYRSRSCADEYSPSLPMVRVAQPTPAQLTVLQRGAIATAASIAAITCSVLVTSQWAYALPYVGGDLVAELVVEVGDDHLDSAGRQCPRGRFTET